jgi:lipopolysaccharide transport system permease protein
VNFLLRIGQLGIDSVCIPLLAAARYRSLMRMLVQRELANRTSGTWLGRLWPLLQPALQVLGFWFLFAVVYDMRTVRGPGFLQYLLLGMLPWLCFSEVLSRGTSLFREFSALYARSPFPLEVLPSVVMVIPALVYTPVLALTVWWIVGGIAAIKSLVVIPLLLVWTLPLLLLCAVIGLFVRDFGQALPFVLMLVMYVTPILYFPDMLPASVKSWLWLNPMSDWMAVIHTWITGEDVPTDSLWRLLAIWLVLLAPAWLWFRRTLLHVRELL